MRAAAGVAAAGALVLCLATTACTPASRPAGSAPTSVQPASRSGPSRSLQPPVGPAAAPAAAAVPVRVRFARLGIDSRLDRLGVSSRAELQTPRSFGRAAWFAAGVRPGDVGPAVIAGHVDSRSGPAVFFRLPSARRGDVVEVTDADGVTRRFDVSAVRRYAKTSFGTAEVYGPTAQPQLRLITCTGSFDRAARSYRDNLVVFATLRGARAG